MKNRTFNYFTLVVVVVATAILVERYFAAGFPITLSTYAGMLLLVPSLFLFALARIQLGSAFQASAAANQLITSGIYKKIRHPVYLFGLLFMLGLIILFQKYVLIIILVAMALMQLRRIKTEEQVLESTFGEQYRDYKKRTWF